MLRSSLLTFFCQSIKLEELPSNFAFEAVLSEPHEVTFLFRQGNTPTTQHQEHYEPYMFPPNWPYEHCPSFQGALNTIDDLTVTVHNSSIPPTLFEFDIVEQTSNNPSQTTQTAPVDTIVHTQSTPARSALPKPPTAIPPHDTTNSTTHQSPSGSSPFLPIMLSLIALLGIATVVWLMLRRQRDTRKKVKSGPPYEKLEPDV